MQTERLLAEMICGAAPGPSDAELARAARHFADLAGVALAAAGEPGLKALAGLCAEAAAGQPSARLWGTHRRFRPREAGLLNGFAAHWHDFDDDETELAMAHVTVSAMTAAAVLGDSRPDLSGKAVLAAYLSGTEAAMRIGALVNPGHYRRGWHATATLGVFAACAAAGRLMGLDPARMRHALGMAASFAAGIRSNFGTDAKPLQVGQAVANGILAAECAASGLESASGSLFGPKGYVALQEGDVSRAEEVVRGFGAPYGVSAGGMVIKAYPCCTAAHSAISCVLSLLADHGLSAADIDRIACHVDPAVAGILIHDRPATAVEAKFSLPFALAAAAVFGRAGLAEFTPAALADPRVRAAMARVERIDDPGLPKGPSGISVAARVVLHLKDGGTAEAFSAAVPGSAGNPLGDEALAAKFVSCAGPLLGAVVARSLFDALLETASAPRFGTLLDAFAPAVGEHPFQKAEVIA